MPLQQCKRDGHPGWKYGESGKCYIYRSDDKESEQQAKAKAKKQAAAIKASEDRDKER